MKSGFQHHIFRLITTANRKVSPKPSPFRSSRPFQLTHSFHHQPARLGFPSSPSATNMEMIQHLDQVDFSPTNKAVFDTFKTDLSIPLSMEVRRAKIANAIAFFCESRGPDHHVEAGFLSIWFIMLKMICGIPPDHEWQECLAAAVDLVRRREGYSGPDPEQDAWSDLPLLLMTLREHWELMPVEGDEEDALSLSSWKNVNSFVSRLVASGFHDGLYLGIWELTYALETPIADAKILDCRVWAAAEWVIRCKEVILDKINTHGQDLDWDEAFDGTGTLYGKSQPPRDLQRWEFWKARLSEMHAQSASLGLSDDTKQHVEAALKAMGSKPRATGHTEAITQTPPLYYPPPEGDAIRKPRRVVTSQNNS